jgi:hypothetical protein
MREFFDYIKEYIPAIITSFLTSGIVTTIISGIYIRKNKIFEKRQEAFTCIINQVSSSIDDIPYYKELDEFLQITKNSYFNFKSNIEKYDLYLNKKEASILAEITMLFAKNINQDFDVFDPDEPYFDQFREEDRRRIIELKDELLFYFKKELGII